MLLPHFLISSLSLGDNDDQLTKSYNVTMSLVEMTKHFMRFDLLDVFYLVKTTVNATDGGLEQVTSPELLFLLDDYTKISIKEIRESTCFFHIYGKHYHIQNLEWSELLLEQSCDYELSWSDTRNVKPDTN